MTNNERALMGAREADVQRQIKDWLTLHGWFVYKNHQSLGSYRGVADLTAIKGGQVLWIEVKAPRGRQSECQAAFQREIEARGGRYLLAKSLDDVIVYIEKVMGRAPVSPLKARGAEAGGASQAEAGRAVRDPEAVGRGFEDRGGAG